MMLRPVLIQFDIKCGGMLNPTSVNLIPGIFRSRCRFHHGISKIEGTIICLIKSRETDKSFNSPMLRICNLDPENYPVINTIS
jgi:hypothetical protein